MLHLKPIATLAFVIILSLAGCSSGISQEDYNTLLAENESLKQELAQYKGEDSTQTEEPNDTKEPSISDYDPNATPSAESDFLYVNNGSAVQINGYQGKGGYVVIPNEIEGVPVTRIATGAFKKIETITGIKLPDSLEFIGDSAFYHAENLTGVLVIPETVSLIEGHAFQVTNLTGIVIQSTCKLEVNAFANITPLEFVYVKEGCSPQIGTSVFGHSEGLTSAIFPSTIIEIKDETFNACNSMTIYTPAGSFAEEYANRNFIKLDTDGYNEQVSKYSKIYG